MKELRVGVVGSGWVANDRYLPVLSKIDGLSLVGIADRHIDRAAASAKKHNTVPFASHLELLDAGLDALFICTSPWSHREIAVDAATRRVHVFSEKPMALDPAEAAEMVDEAKKAGVLLGVSHNFLFSRSMLRARKTIESGTLGDIRHVYAFQASSPKRRLPPWYPELRGGLFFDESPHMIYLIDHLIGHSKVQSAWARPAQDDNAQPIEMLEARLSGTQATATLSMVFSAPVSEWLIIVIGTEGILSIDMFRDICVRLGSDRGHGPVDILRTSGVVIGQHLVGTVGTGTRVLSHRQFWGHDVVIQGFIDAIREGGEPLVSGNEGARVVRLMTRILDAVGY